MNMRPGPNNNNNNKRGRGRGRGKHQGGGGSGGGGGGGGGGPRHQSSSHQNQDQVFNIHRTIDSNGPDVKIRGNAHHIYEKYLQLARDANSSGDRVMAENYLQHAEHYYRLIMAYQTHLQQQQGGGQPYGNAGQQSNQPPSQAGHYGGPYRNQTGGGSGQQGDPNGNTFEGGNGSGNGNGNGNGEAVVTSSVQQGGPQDDVYNEEDNGRYD
ncbi:MAG: DUF4167 domain-containing protein [Micropepsaceae bacterium]